MKMKGTDSVVILWSRFVKYNMWNQTFTSEPGRPETLPDQIECFIRWPRRLNAKKNIISSTNEKGKPKTKTISAKKRKGDPNINLKYSNTQI